MFEWTSKPTARWGVVEREIFFFVFANFARRAYKKKEPRIRPQPAKSCRNPLPPEDPPRTLGTFGAKSVVRSGEDRGTKSEGTASNRRRRKRRATTVRGPSANYSKEKDGPIFLLSHRVLRLFSCALPFGLERDREEIDLSSSLETREEKRSCERPYLVFYFLSFFFFFDATTSRQQSSKASRFFFFEK